MSVISNNFYLKHHLKAADINIMLKTKKVIKCLSFMILSQEAKLKSVWGPTLTPLIGKDKITDFCNVFNKDSILLYENDVFIPTFFLLFENKTFSYILRTPTIFNIIKYIFDIDKIYRFKYFKKVVYYITAEELFYIMYIKYNDILYSDFSSCLKELLNNLQNFNIKIIQPKQFKLNCFV